MNKIQFLSSRHFIILICLVAGLSSPAGAQITYQPVHALGLEIWRNDGGYRNSISPSTNYLVMGWANDCGGEMNFLNGTWLTSRGGNNFMQGNSLHSEGNFNFTFGNGGGVFNDEYYLPGGLGDGTLNFVFGQSSAWGTTGSMAMGLNNCVIGNSAAALGSGTIANSFASLVVGSNNAPLPGETSGVSNSKPNGLA